jgi:hypothetical protein
MSDAPNPGDLSDPAAHDVLAAEEFAVPAPDPSIAHSHVVLPEDPSGIAEPHDVLAAEEFALPATPPHPGGPVVPQRPGRSRTGVAALGALALVVALLRRRRRAV